MNAIKKGSVIVFFPLQQVLAGSLRLLTPGKSFCRWSTSDHAHSYELMQRTALVWKESQLTDQYLIYGKVDTNPFHWEMLPYQRCLTCIGRIVQQLQVLWRIVFGVTTISQEQCNDQLEAFKTQLNGLPAKINPPDILNTSNDAFCNHKTIDRQWVMKGKRVNVLFNYAPIGFGGERLHFLVVPIRHREAFTDVTKEEYCESLALTNRLIDRLKKTRNIESVYLLNKTGIDAGQTVKHWHLHVVFCTNKAQDFWGKWTVFKNILIGSSPMKEDALAQKVSDLREEFSSRYCFAFTN